MEKLAEKSVTDALIKAMEIVDRMKRVVILYETTDEYEETHGNSYGCIIDAECDMRTLNYMLDIGKDWIFRQ